eukprot:gene9640-10408_t
MPKGKTNVQPGPPTIDISGEKLCFSKSLSIHLQQKIGAGGFGVIYKGRRVVKDKPDGFAIVKMENASSSGLYAEMKCLERLELTEWKSKGHKTWLKTSVLKHFPFAIMYACTVLKFQGQDYRFLAMLACGPSIADLVAKHNSNNRNSPIPVASTLSIALQISEAMHYVHDRGYIHGDIKPENICTDVANPSRVYLIDFGCCDMFSDGKDYSFSNHQPFEVLNARQHDGTLEFTGVDSHTGAKLSRRGDFEMLCYVLLQLIVGEPTWFPLCRKVTDKMRNTIGSKVETEKRHVYI